MKTVLQVTGTMDRGGAEMMLMDLVRKLYNDFHFVFLIVRKKGTEPIGDFDDELRSLGIELHYIDAVWDVGVKAFSHQFHAVIKQIGTVDIIHSHLNSKGGIISKCAADCGIKRRILHSHARIRFNGSLISKFANYSELYLQRFWINKYATDFFGCSEDALASLFTKKHRTSNRAQIIHNAIDLAKFSQYQGTTVRDELGISESAFVLGTVGRIAAVKNYELAADIIDALWNRDFDCHYIVAGRQQTEKSVQYLISKLGHDSRFHYIGVREDLPTVYHSFNLYLGTSLREGLGMTAVEAQSSGIRCLLSEGFPVLCDVGADLVTFMNSNNADDWADYIITLAENTASVSVELVEDAVRNAGFDVEEEAERVKGLYNQ